MADPPALPLIIRSRVSAWGCLVALLLAPAFLLTGMRAVQALLLPHKVGIFVEPPSWIVGALLIGFATFLFMVGIAELARYLRPSTEVIVDRDGIALYGLLGERRVTWSDVEEFRSQRGTLAIRPRQRGRLRPADLRIHFDRLDVEPADVLAAIRLCRPDLAPQVATTVNAPARSGALSPTR